MIIYLNVRLSSYRYEQDMKLKRERSKEELSMKWQQWDREVSCRVKQGYLIVKFPVNARQPL